MVYDKQGWPSGEILSPLWCRVRYPELACDLSLWLILSLASRVFLRVLRFSSLDKNQLVSWVGVFKTINVEVVSVRETGDILDRANL